MSPGGQSGRIRSAVAWLAGLLTLAGVAVALVGLPGDTLPDTSAPRPPVDRPGQLPGEMVTCERTLSDAPVTAEQPEPGTGDPPAVRDPASIGRVTSTQLVECPTRFDGRTVVYVGEVVGDVLARDGGAWVLMNDDPYALELGPLPGHGEHRGYNSGVSVWLDGRLADLADEPGRAGRRGDVLRVRGVVHRADPDDGGGLTIRASDGEVVADAAPVETSLDVPQAVIAAGLAALAGAIVVLERLTQRAR